jgi:hypothetical protein
MMNTIGAIHKCVQTPQKQMIKIWEIEETVYLLWSRGCGVEGLLDELCASHLSAAGPEQWTEQNQQRM